VQLRSESIVVPPLAEPSTDECATSLVSGLVFDAVDDIVTELDYFTDDDCPLSPASIPDAVQVFSAGEPAIIEQAEEVETSMTVIFEEAVDSTAPSDMCSSDEEVDDLDVCDFDSDVCSMTSENSDEAEDIADVWVASAFAKKAVSDEVIMEAFTYEEGEDQEDEVKEEEVECVEFLGEPAVCGDELAFDYASGILDGAFEQATTTWTKQAELQVSSPAMSAIEVLKEKAKQSLIKFAQEKAAEETQTESLKRRAREGLLKAAQAKAAAVEVASRGSQVQEMRSQIQKAFSIGLQNGALSRALEVATTKEDKHEGLRNKVRETLLKGVASGKLQAAFNTVVDKTEESVDNQDELKPNMEQPLEEDPQADSQREMKQMPASATASGKLAGELRVKQETEAIVPPSKVLFVPPPPTDMSEKMPPVLLPSKQSEDTSSVSTARALQSSRSRRRIIGGVMRAPAMQRDSPDIEPPANIMQTRRSKADLKASQEPKAFRMDLDIEAAVEDDTRLARASSLTRSYDTLGVQFYSLAAEDEPVQKQSKARARLQAATSMSAMAMDLKPPMSAMAMDLTENVSSPSASMHRSCSSPSFHQKFTPTPFNLDYSSKMRPSASTGSLASSKMKYASGGLLPAIAPNRKSAESIAWTMQVSKTTSKLSSTGLRGSASMIF
jgi:hypothetical protein